MGLSEQQAAVVDALDNSVNIAAGAGTGKTFTLTERIVHAIDVLSQQTDELPTRRIAAITFTEAAASELRSRVRQTLFDRAKDDSSGLYLKCALDIDNAWISTIHGMASRILHENALQFGLDPAFEVMNSSDTSNVTKNALEMMLSDSDLRSNPLAKELFDEFDLYPKFFDSPSIIGFINTVLDFTSRMPGGINSIDIPQPSLSPSQIIKGAYDNSILLKELLSQNIYAPKDTEKAQAWIEQIEIAQEAALNYLESNTSDSFLDDDFDKALFIRILGGFPITTNRFGSKKDTGAELERFRYEQQKLAQAAHCGLGARYAHGVLRIAEVVDIAKETVKDDLGGSFDNNDLLIVCNQKLLEHPEISKRYKDHFFQIMVDEFQDTDKLQMQILRSISKDKNAREEAEELANVCTVGDMQQSIYRFRGGDVRESVARKRELSKREGAQFSLSQNYRTHGDVLQAVEIIFDRENAFGDGFLKLTPACETLDPSIAEQYKNKPRVTFDFISYGIKDESGETVKVDDARKAAAAEIADHFYELHQKGAPLSKMSLLLGVMTNSNVYAEAFRNRGLNCKVTGGSVFTKSEEAKLVKAILAYGANQSDEVSLLNLLISPLFDISDDTLMALTFDEHGKRRSIARVCQGSGDLTPSRKRVSNHPTPDITPDIYNRITDEEEKTLLAAINALRRYRQDIKTKSASCALRELLVASGLLVRLSGAGEAGTVDNGDRTDSISYAANISKAITIVESLEAGSFGINDLYQRYSQHLMNEKEAPGSLSTDETGFISIMTIHSSKGLEFDHVAIAEMKDGSGSSGNISLEAIDDDAIMAFTPKESSLKRVGLDGDFTNISKVMEFDFPSIEDLDDEITEASIANDPVSQNHFFDLRSYSCSEEMAEARRLAYVAMTRARETLYLSLVSKGESYKGIYKDMYAAIAEHFKKGEEGFKPICDESQMPIRMVRRCIMPSDMAGKYAYDDNAHSADLKFVIPVFDEAEPMNVDLTNYWREGIYSYSSLSGNMHGIVMDDSPRSFDDLADPEDESFEVDGSDGSTKGAEVADGTDPVEYSECIKSNADLGDSTATDLGSAFHRLAQIAILDSGDAGKPGHLICPSDDLVDNISKSLGLSNDHISRLNKALDLWFGSTTANEFESMLYRQAEVPFATEVKGKDLNFTLEGEIDGLATNDGDHALLIDYKTGGSNEETDEALHDKHLLQATCYAYALIKAGFTSVDARFIRVERSNPEDPNSNQEVRYSFDAKDVNELENAITRAYISTVNEKSD